MPDGRNGPLTATQPLSPKTTKILLIELILRRRQVTRVSSAASAQSAESVRELLAEWLVENHSWASRWLEDRRELERSRCGAEADRAVGVVAVRQVLRLSAATE